MKKQILIIFFIVSIDFPIKAQFLNSEAMSGFSGEMDFVIEQWKPDDSNVMELRVKPSWENHFLPRRGLKRYSLLLQYVSDSVLKQQDYCSSAEYLVKTSEGWIDYDNHTGKRYGIYNNVFIKDSAGYRIEKNCSCTGNESCCTISFSKTDSLNRVVERISRFDSTIYICYISYPKPNKIWWKNISIVGVDTTVLSEYYSISEPNARQIEKTDSLIVVQRQNQAVKNDTIVTITHYQYNRQGKIVRIKRTEQYFYENSIHMEKSECIVIYRKRYPKRHVRFD